jgi:hypothetical protein
MFVCVSSTNPDSSSLAGVAVVVGAAAVVYYIYIKSKGRISGTALARAAEASGLTTLTKRGGRLGRRAASHFADKAIGVRLCLLLGGDFFK